jgi:hypothetical protein
MILKLKSSRLSYMLVLIWPLSSDSMYKSKNDVDEAVSVVYDDPILPTKQALVARNNTPTFSPPLF